MWALTGTGSLVPVTLPAAIYISTLLSWLCLLSPLSLGRSSTFLASWTSWGLHCISLWGVFAGTLTLSHTAWSPELSFEILVNSSMTSQLLHYTAWQTTIILGHSFLTYCKWLSGENSWQNNSMGDSVSEAPWGFLIKQKSLKWDYTLTSLGLRWMRFCWFLWYPQGIFPTIPVQSTWLLFHIFKLLPLTNSKGFWIT